MTATQTIVTAPVETEEEVPSETELAFVIRQDHIERGVRGMAHQCAAALALKQMGFRDVLVGPGVVKTDARFWYTGLALADWIARFDDCQAVHPDRFVLKPAPLR